MFSDKSHHVQLSIWDVLESASVRPLDTDFAMLLVRVDESIASLPIGERLSAAGDAIACLGAIYGERCAVRLAEIDYLNHPDWEPCLSLDLALIFGSPIVIDRDPRLNRSLHSPLCWLVALTSSRVSPASPDGIRY
ncbi:hypothetical protein [Chamaesiphon minutus]|uniref:Uncharacterized protein n=1 Tax=Chamaesiphon minutus (strain ATCC 27169 / PCC 6605) TaxID=1173020 RepID=K9UQW1_CHAP6|nr:hypothetical protein [Chamaesiphon minutus]AFY97073.1 hypothetical protein Cha6605_6246 [Chamaesiphon minutus PCC 6605]